MHPTQFQDLNLLSSQPNSNSSVGFQSREMIMRNDDRVDRKTKICSRGHWRPAEDAKLLELIAEHGPQNWNWIAEQIPGRSGKSCRLRWCNQLDPGINKKPIGDEEELKLLAAHRLYGNKWSLIAKLLPGRTDNAVKNHWHVVMSRRQREQHSLYSNRKRKLAPCSNSNGYVIIKPRNANACNSETTNSSTIDESASACNAGATCSFLNINYIQRFQSNGPPQMGAAAKCVQSDSNSEVNAAESININKNHLSGKDGNENINMTFIDFLGVGDS